MRGLWGNLSIALQMSCPQRAGSRTTPVTSMAETLIRALRDPARPVRPLIGLGVLSAVTALPAFLVDGVPAGAQVVAAAVVVLTAVGVVLTSGVARQVVTS